jgi:phosphoribosyl 1,2-cyclic phosphodiesterase
MYVKFWGTRGSIPTSTSSQSLRYKIQQALEGAAGLNLADESRLDRYLERLPFAVQSTTGGNTPCVEVRSGDQILIIDAGSGLRLLGLDLMRRGFALGHQRVDFLITHTHWDHIQGFPFFAPAFVPDNRLSFYSPFADLAARLETQQQPRFFPVPISTMPATLEFGQLAENRWHRLGNFKIFPMKLSHPGSTYGYRIEDDRSSLVCASDAEYKRVDPASTENYVAFFREADLIIFDAQYNLAEVLDRPDWGHSTAVMGVELAHRARARRLALFHHDPASSDEKIWAGKEQAEAYLARRQSGLADCEVMVAYDGLNLEI